MAEPPTDRAASDLAAALTALDPVPARGGRAGWGAAALGQRLISLGLNERAVCACFAVRVPGHAPLRAATLPLPDPLPPAAVLPWLLAAGHPVPAATAERRLGVDLPRLIELGLLARDGADVRPAFMVLPAGRSLVVCTLDRPGGGARPDDSSYHLLGTLPARRVDRWLDVGTGNGFLPLAARALGAVMRATDVDAGALALARAGALLSGAGDLELARADLLGGAGERPWPLVTFNAPLDGAIPLLERFHRALPEVVADGGEALIHSVLAPGLVPATGQAIAARYTPAGVEPAFAVTWWRPGPARPPRMIEIALTGDRPHLRRADLE